jgi:hypothetical protein
MSAPAGTELAAIIIELHRIQADVAPSPAHTIGVSDELGGWISLGASEKLANFYWYGRSDEALSRLRRLPGSAGPEAIRLEFSVDLPPELRD